MNLLYVQQSPNWQLDYSREGFQWLDCSPNPCVFAYTRTSAQGQLLVILNFSNHRASIQLQPGGAVKMLLNSNWNIYGGSLKKAARTSISKTIAPYSAMVFSMES